jgi:hypothetical protein
MRRDGGGSSSEMPLVSAPIIAATVGMMSMSCTGFEIVEPRRAPPGSFTISGTCIVSR